MKTKEKKYKVEYIQTEKFIVDVYAKDEKQAEKKADKMFEGGDYHETGDTSIDLNAIYDVTDTDDPFSA